MRESGAYALGMRSVPPAELLEYFTCRTWGLPNGQGWMNEPINYTQKISIAGNAYHAIKSMQASKNWAEWHQNNPDLSILVMEIMNQLDV